MSPRGQHVDALARAVLERLESSEPQSVRRLLLAQVDAVARLLRLEARGASVLAGQSGIAVLVEDCRNEYLRGLDADAALAMLELDWEEVVLRVALHRAHERRIGMSRCSRCGGDTVEVTYRGHRRRPPGRHFRRVGTTDLYRARRCSSCGLVRPPNTG